MEVKTNSAIRLRNIIKKAYDNKNQSTLDVWKDIFQIDEKDIHSTKISVISCIDDLKNEFNILKNDMSNTSFSIDLYSKEISQLQNHLIDPISAIIGDWKSKKQQITDVQFKILDFCSEILPNDELVINQEDIEKLKVLINELEELLNANQIPNDLIQLIKKHLKKIKTALYTYNINGANVFDEVLKSAYGEVISNPNIFKDTSDIKIKLSNIWGLTKDLYEKAKDVNSIYTDFNDIANTVQNLLPSGN